MADFFWPVISGGGGGGGSGTVTSVALSAPAIFSVSGSPVTTSGTLTIALANQNANLVWAGPSTGVPAAPSFRSLVDADIPTIANSKLDVMAASTFKANATGGVATPTDITGTDATALLDTFTSGLKGLAPASGGGTSNFLRADGTWAAPASSGANTTLSNLTATTAINQDLFFDVTNTRSIGSNTNYPLAVNAGSISADLTLGMGVRDFAVLSNPVLTMASRSLPDGTASVVSLASGSSTTLANQRIAALMSRNQTGTVPTGLVTLQSGNQTGSVASGDILLRVGTVISGTRGTIRFVDASLTGSSVGYVWTLQNTTTGAGAWAAAAAGGANTTLSNLTSPTAINQNLIPSGTRVLGSTASPWASLVTPDISGGNADLFIRTDDQASANSNAILVRSGQVTTAGNTGDVLLGSGNHSGTGNSGAVVLRAGTVGAGTRGKIVFIDGSEGVAGYVWTSVGTGGEGGWAPASGGASPLTTKGDLYTYDTADARLGVGTNGQFLSADSTEPTGLKWVSAGPSGANTALSNLVGPTAINEDLIFDKTTPILQTKAQIGAASQELQIRTGTTTGNFQSGQISLYSGDTAGTQPTGAVAIYTGTAAGVGAESGYVQLSTGTPGLDANSGQAIISTGGGSGTGSSGVITIGSGNVDAGNAGNINIQAGTSNTGSGGNINISAGDSTSGTEGSITLTIPTGGVITMAGTTDFNNKIVYNVANPSSISNPFSTNNQIFDVDFAKARQGIIVKWKAAYPNFTAAALTEDIELFSLPAGWMIKRIMLKHDASWNDGGTVSAATLSLGITGNLTKYASAFDVFQAPGGTVFQISNNATIEDFGNPTSVRLALAVVGANINTLNSGGVDLSIEVQNYSDFAIPDITI